jgi:hypothetical protein
MLIDSRGALSAAITRNSQTARRTTAGHWYLWLNTFGVDASFVAVSWQHLLARSLHIHLRSIETTILGLLCWLVYAVDHLLDAVNAQAGHTVSYRHEFLRNHARAMAWIFGSIVLVIFFLASALLAPRPLKQGLLASSAVAAYMLLVHVGSRSSRSRWPREFAVGVLFASGTSLFVWTEAGAAAPHVVLPFALLACLCCINCAGVKYWSWIKNDTTEPRPSVWAMWVGRQLSLVCTGFAAAVLTLQIAGVLGSLFTGAVMLSTSALFVLSLASDALDESWLRAFADLALCTPGVFLVLGSMR